MALEQELVDFVQHCQEHPGRPYKAGTASARTLSCGEWMLLRGQPGGAQAPALESATQP